MTLKLFDDFRVWPGSRQKPDLLIVARIKDRGRLGWGEPRCVSFIIAWLLDTASL